jgi:hypothetical protein
MPTHSHPRQVSAMTYVRHVNENSCGEIEEVFIRTIGVKGIEVHTALANQSLPVEVISLLPPPLPPSLSSSSLHLSSYSVATQ